MNRVSEQCLKNRKMLFLKMDCYMKIDAINSLYNKKK